MYDVPDMTCQLIGVGLVPAPLFSSTFYDVGIVTAIRPGDLVIVVALLLLLPLLLRAYIGDPCNVLSIRDTFLIMEMDRNERNRSDIVREYVSQA